MILTFYLIIKIGESLFSWKYHHISYSEMGDDNNNDS